jgi:hypothetical protein
LTTVRFECSLPFYGCKAGAELNFKTGDRNIPVDLSSVFVPPTNCRFAQSYNQTYSPANVVSSGRPAITKFAFWNVGNQWANGKVIDVTILNEGNCERKTCPVKVNIQDTCGFKLYKCANIQNLKFYNNLRNMSVDLTKIFVPPSGCTFKGNFSYSTNITSTFLKPASKPREGTNIFWDIESEPLTKQIVTVTITDNASKE